MIRQISPDPALVPESRPVVPAVVPAAAPASAAVPASADTRDALAGALPAWDLLPASPFIRRFK